VSATPELRDYIVAIAAATRDRPEVLLGVSPRGSMALLRAARARAAIEGRQYATAADVKALTPAVCGHRMILTPQAELDEVSAESVLRTILEDTPVPSSRVAW
jgi:MoxR-like ATPase